MNLYKGEEMKTKINAITKVANNKDTRTELYEHTMINTNSPYYFTEKSRKFFNSKIRDIFVIGQDLNDENLNAKYGGSILKDVDYILLIEEKEEKTLTNSSFVEYKEYQIILINNNGGSFYKYSLNDLESKELTPHAYTSESYKDTKKLLEDVILFNFKTSMYYNSNYNYFNTPV
tara:strand:+ start:197 stop:721 length:525 start_codon:yes stop_codon:yes gene_type:complete